MADGFEAWISNHRCIIFLILILITSFKIIEKLEAIKQNNDQNLSDIFTVILDIGNKDNLLYNHQIKNFISIAEEIRDNMKEIATSVYNINNAADVMHDAVGELIKVVMKVQGIGDSFNENFSTLVKKINIIRTDINSDIYK